MHRIDTSRGKIVLADGRRVDAPPHVLNRASLYTIADAIRAWAIRSGIISETDEVDMIH